MTSTSGSAIVGEEYSITCAVMGADNLDATFRIEWQRPGGDSLLIGILSSLTHTFSPLGQGDEGEYTCGATITTDLLLESPLTRTVMLDITVAGKSVSVCVCIKYMYQMSSFMQAVETISYFVHGRYTCKCVRNDNNSCSTICNTHFIYVTAHPTYMHVLVLGIVVCK